MTGGIDDIDFRIFVHHSGVLGENGDTTLTLDVIGIHHTFRHFLILTKYAALL